MGSGRRWRGKAWEKIWGWALGYLLPRKNCSAQRGCCSPVFRQAAGTKSTAAKTARSTDSRSHFPAMLSFFCCAAAWAFPLFPLTLL